VSRASSLTNRRAFIGSLALATLARPRAAPAQPARKVYRIGILGLGSPTSDMVGPQPQSESTAALLRGLRELGYVYGEHFVTEPRGGEGKPERFPNLAAELVRLQVDVIVAAGPTLPALKQATSTIPVVMSAADDPVGLGLIESLGHPGRNFTGLSNQSVETTAKRLELLKELVPSAAPVAVLWERLGLLYWQAAEAAARTRGWKLVSIESRHAGEIEGAFSVATDARAGALLVFSTPLFFPQARQLADLAARSRLPAMYEIRQHVEAGGLISYGADTNEIWRRGAVFVDKILKGAKPRDLPVEQAQKFEFVINMTTAKTLGVTIPQSLLLRVDEVIQ
jgi:putative ABC transport system substrate-binding protein